MSKSKSEEILTEDLAFDSFFSEQNFENTLDESERMCNMNTHSAKMMERHFNVKLIFTAALKMMI